MQEQAIKQLFSRWFYKSGDLIILATQLQLFYWHIPLLVISWNSLIASENCLTIILVILRSLKKTNQHVLYGKVMTTWCVQLQLLVFSSNSLLHSRSGSEGFLSFLFHMSFDFLGSRSLGDHLLTLHIPPGSCSCTHRVVYGTMAQIEPPVTDFQIWCIFLCRPPCRFSFFRKIEREVVWCAFRWVLL